MQTFVKMDKISRNFSWSAQGAGYSLRPIPWAMGNCFWLAILLSLVMAAYGCHTTARPEREVGNPTDADVVPHTTTEHTTKVFQDYRIPGYPDTIRICGQHIYYTPSKEYFAWEAFICFVPPAQVVEYYREKLGEEGFTPTEEGGTWCLKETVEKAGEEAEPPQIVRMVQVIPVHEHGLPDLCFVPPQAQTIILISLLRPIR